jgi:hypothetical protein
MKNKLVLSVLGIIIIALFIYVWLFMPSNAPITPANETKENKQECNPPFFDIGNGCNVMANVQLSSFIPLGNWTLASTYQRQDDSRTVCKPIDNNGTLECEPKMLTYEVWYRKMQYKNLTCNVIRDRGIMSGDYPYVRVQFNFGIDKIYVDENHMPLNMDVECLEW